MATPDSEDVTARGICARYVKSARILRQIHSNKAQRANVYGQTLTALTVIIGAAVTFVGFGNLGGLFTKINSMAEAQTFNLIYSLSVLLLVTISLLGLLFRHEAKSVQHYRSVERLTEFIRDYEDRIALSVDGVEKLRVLESDQCRNRYKAILETLLPNTDDEWTQAKTDYNAKEQDSLGGMNPRPIDETIGNSASPGQLREFQFALRRSQSTMEVLKIVRDELGDTFWVSGGCIRGPVWDQLHNYAMASSLDDVDVLHYDSMRKDQVYDLALLGRLKARQPNIRWSVKNESRMHLINDCAPYTSLQDALSHFPETATAIAVRLGTDDALHVVAPLGLCDLLSGIVRPNPLTEPGAYQRRLASKDWASRWPGLRIWPPI